MSDLLQENSVDVDTEEMQTMRDCIRWGVSRFNEAGLCHAQGMPDAVDEAVYLCLCALHLPHDLGESYFDSRLTQAEKTAVFDYYEQRLQRIPSAYITNEAWFCDMSFYVDQRVLIPRSPIAELVREGFKPWLTVKNPKILDLCTGSGCIAIACATHLEGALVTASDISEEALDVAMINVEKHAADDSVSLVTADLFEGLEETGFDLIVSNPPYVPRSEVESLPEEFDLEPKEGLLAGENGLDFVIRILKHARSHLGSSGVLIVEVGHTWRALQELYPSVPFTWLEFRFGGEGVFLLTAELLEQNQPTFDDVFDEVVNAG